MQERSAELPTDVQSFFARYPVVLFSYVRFRPTFYVPELISAFGILAKHRPDVGLLLCASEGHSEENLPQRTADQIASAGLQSRVLMVDDLPHDQFLRALLHSALYVRTPVTDGVASSVLESLSLGIPVVASENGSRPPGVITYPATDADALGRLLIDVLARRPEIVAALPRPPLRDTLSEEIRLLTA
jgi:glycosyltransferase involved in cell wall biosynthesis